MLAVSLSRTLPWSGSASLQPYSNLLPTNYTQGPHVDLYSKMSSSSSNGASAHVFSASYQSPTNEPFSFSTSFPLSNAENVDERTAYLRHLREAVADIQDKVNKELTARMEEDKVREATAAGKKVADVDETKEEENYGEEVVEEEE